MRFDKPIGTILLFWPCVWGLKAGYDATGSHDTLIFLKAIGLFGLGSFIMRSIGCIINDIVDHDLDKKVERTQNRPLANSSLSLNHAYFLIGILGIISFIIFIQLPYISQICALIGGALMIIYPFSKSFTSHPQVFLGFAFSSGVLTGYTYAHSVLNLASITLMCFSICWVIAFDTIYAFQDLEDDKKCKIGSTALKYENFPKTAIGIWYFTGILFLSLHSYLTQKNIVNIKIILFTCFMIYVLIKWKPLNNESSARYFKLHGIAGISGLL